MLTWIFDFNQFQLLKGGHERKILPASYSRSVYVKSVHGVSAPSDLKPQEASYCLACEHNACICFHCIVIEGLISQCFSLYCWSHDRGVSHLYCTMSPMGVHVFVCVCVASSHISTNVHADDARPCGESKDTDLSILCTHTVHPETARWLLPWTLAAMCIAHVSSLHSPW